MRSYSSAGLAWGPLDFSSFYISLQMVLLLEMPLLSARGVKVRQFSVNLVLRSRPCLGLPHVMVTMHDWFVSPVLVERWFQLNFRQPLAG